MLLTRALAASVLLSPLSGCRSRTTDVGGSVVQNTAAPTAPVTPADTSKLIVITDMEPDDRMALQLLAAHVPPSRIAFMGTTVMHAARKKALLCRLNQQLGYDAVEVYQGKGRDPAVDYLPTTIDDDQGSPMPIGTIEIAPGRQGDFLIPRVAARHPGGHDQQIGALNAARSFTEEGHVLPEAVRQRVTQMPRASSDLTNQLISYFTDPSAPETTILLLAAPTELEEAIAARPEIAAKIKNVYLQGGWTILAPKPANPQQQPAPTLPVPYSMPPRSEPLCADTFDRNGNDDGFVKQGHLCLTTYNWDLDIAASERFMRRTRLPMTLFSSHVIKDVFPGGSINPRNGAAIWDVLQRPDVAALASIKDTRAEISAWDEHVMRVIPALRPVIEPFKDSQFTPADPSVVAGFLALDELAPPSTRMPVAIDIDPSIIVVATGYGVTYRQEPTSRISLLTKLDPQAFVRTFARGMGDLPRAIERNRQERAGMATTCSSILGAAE